MTATSGRDLRIDALRGFALLGILLVNIQSFLWGGTNPAGYLHADAGAADRVTFFITVTFFNLKFMPLFAMLFGVGFALLLAKLARITSDPHAVYRRRLLFLFVFGVLHGVFFYYGDITQMYALAGLMLLLYDERDVQGLRRAALHWWIGAAVWMVTLTWWAMGDVEPPDYFAAEVQSNFIAFTELSYVGQWPTRLRLYRDIVIANVAGLPLTVALMLTGMLAQRAGWLANPPGRALRVALALGLLIGLPAALLYGRLVYAEADANALGAFSLLAGIPGVVSVSLAFAYAALFLQYAPAWLVRWLAAPGRMPLTNYLLQSIAMGALLSGWGLALGPRLTYWEMALLALAIFIVQTLGSRLWLQHWSQGPLEMLWRRWTYFRMPPPRADREAVRSEG